MGEQKNTITVNGKVYDSRSGAIHGDAKHLIKPKTKTIDGVYHSSPTNIIRPKIHKAAVDHGSTDKKLESTPKRSAHHIAHRNRQHAKTLMRSAVTKPIFATPSKATSVVADKKSLSGAVKSASVQQVIGEQRAKRAQEVSKSHMVSRFGNISSSASVIKKHTSIAVKKAPEEEITSHHESPIIESIIEPVKTAEALFADALSNATSHLQPEVKHKRGSNHRSTRRKAANALALVAVVFTLGGFIAYQNTANIAVKVASSKAGINGTLPGYKPSGFALSKKVEQKPGQIVLTFNSNSDNRKFALTQSASNWDSETLLDSYVVATGQDYQKVDSSNGKTIYTYGDSNATWVDGGVWYKVEGNSGLTSQQILKIANSL